MVASVLIGLQSGTENFGQSNFGGEVIDARFLVIHVERHGEVVLGEQTMGETADIRDVEGESRAQFAADGEIERVGIGSLQLVVDAPGDGTAPTG